MMLRSTSAIDSEPRTRDGVATAHPVGKRTLVQQLAVADAPPSPERIHRIADAATARPGGPLPHGATIQQLFGRHDVTGVQAHTDERAAAAAREIGAAAFAVGDHVAFAGTPTLHTAAHEAAHVVQQRAGVALAGGVGSHDDEHERHADQVAACVVRGASAEALLDQYAVRGSAGNAAPARAIQRRLEKTLFGSYWVGPGEPVGELAADVERISAEDFGRLSGFWDQLRGGRAGQFSIAEQDDKGKSHGGFRTRILAALGQLLSRPKGRMLITQLAVGGQSVLIRPLSSGHDNQARVNGPDQELGQRTKEQHVGTKVDVVVELDPQLGDAPISVFDQDYKEMKQPGFITLGHELIHARHLTRGEAAPRGAAPVTSDYHEREEEETIDTGNPLDAESPTENALRDEHHLTRRFGHEGITDTDRKLTKLPGPQCTLAEAAVLGGVDQPTLLADNPALASDILEKDMSLARHYVESGGQAQLLGTLDSTIDDDFLGDATEFTVAAAPVLREDRDLAVKALTIKHAKLKDLFSRDYITQAASDLKLETEFGQRADDDARTVLTQYPKFVSAVLQNESCLQDLAKDERVRRKVSALPRVRRTLGLRAMTVAKLLEQTGATVEDVFGAIPDSGSLVCPSRHVMLRGCTKHYVRRIDGHAENLAEVCAGYPKRGDEALIAKLNPGVNLNELTVGKCIVVPIAFQ